MGEVKKGLDQGEKAVCMIVGGFIGMILSALLIGLLGIVSIILLIISILSVVIGFIVIMMEKSNDNAAHIANINAFQNEYNEYVEKLGIVKSGTQVTLISLDEACNTHLPMQHYLWIENGKLNIFPMAQYFIRWHTSSMSKPDISELKLKSIPIDSILYFEEVGELRKYTTISGGGSSLKGALLGYAIADDVGAIIGSREPITTNVVSEDDRKVELIYRDENNEVTNLEFMHDAYDVFKKLIPLKELRKIASLNTVQGTKETVINGKKSKHIKEKLKQLNELKTDGLITEEEYTEQRKKILESL